MSAAERSCETIVELAVRASRQVLSLPSRTADAIMVRPGDLEAVSRELARGAR